VKAILLVAGLTGGRILILRIVRKATVMTMRRCVASRPLPSLVDHEATVVFNRGEHSSRFDGLQRGS